MNKIFVYIVLILNSSMLIDTMHCMVCYVMYGI